MKKILFISFLSILFLGFLFFNSTISTRKNNGFSRRYNEHLLEQVKIKTLTLNSYFLQNLSSDNIILGNYSAPHIFEVYDRQLNRKFEHTIHNHQLKSIFRPAFNVNYSDSFYFAFNGRTGDVYSGPIFKNLPASYLCSLRDFDKGILIGKDFVIRYFDTSQHQQIIRKVTSCNLSSKCFSPKKTQDGLFSTDGLIISDFRHQSFFYVYFYRNEFVRLDSDLNIVYRARTIDTNSTPKLSISEISKTGVLKLNKPPVTLYYRGCADAKFLYLQSALIADNESTREFNSRSTVDIYRIKNGRYCCSIVIPNHKNKRISSFVVSNQALFAIHDELLKSYSINHFH